MKKNLGTNVALVAVFAALIAAFALIPPLFMVAGVAFAIQLIVVLLAPLVIGPWQGMLANLLYVIVGILGLPVFAGGKSGIGVLAGPSGGYLIGYVLGAGVIGLIASLALARRPNEMLTGVGLTVAAIAGVLVIHLCGVLGLMVNLKMSFSIALGATTAFVPLDLVKSVIAAVVALAIIKAFPRLLDMRI